jgi:hypothetical protein
MLPPEVPVAHDIDFAELAQRYEMTGRFINNAVVRAAHLAAGDQLPGLTNATLHRAAQLECEARRCARVADRRIISKRCCDGPRGPQRPTRR